MSRNDPLAAPHESFIVLIHRRIGKAVAERHRSLTATRSSHED